MQRERFFHPFLQTARRAGIHFTQLTPDSFQRGLRLRVARHRVGGADLLESWRLIDCLRNGIPGLMQMTNQMD